jgi:DNA-binding MarR family transcriptional regulator
MKTPKNAHSVNSRIREGLSRVAAVLRSDEWERAKILGLNPTQLAILVLLEGRAEGLGVKEIAAHLGVSQPTATDSINALEKKGHVEKRPGLADGRSVSVRLSTTGVTLLRQETESNIIGSAIAALGDAAQEELLVTLITIIRQLQEKNAIPVQRMCVTCRYFDPFAHLESDKPHHCHFVHAPFGQRGLRVDCREHELADPTSRAATWDAFEAG